MDAIFSSNSLLSPDFVVFSLALIFLVVLFHVQDMVQEIARYFFQEQNCSIFALLFSFSRRICWWIC